MQGEVSWNITSEFLESIFANGRMLKRGYSKIEEEINYFTFTHFLQFYRKQSSSTRKFLNIYTYYNFKIPIFVIRNLDIRLAHRISNNSPNLLISKSRSHSEARSVERFRPRSRRGPQQPPIGLDPIRRERRHFSTPKLLFFFSCGMEGTRTTPFHGENTMRQGRHVIAGRERVLRVHEQIIIRGGCSPSPLTLNLASRPLSRSVTARQEEVDQALRGFLCRLSDSLYLPFDATA